MKLRLENGIETCCQILKLSARIGSPSASLPLSVTLILLGTLEAFNCLPLSVTLL